MLSIDMQNAVEDTADNFTCKLFQLMFKADNMNFGILEKAFPVEAAMVWMYRNNCVYIGDSHDVDYQALEQIATKNITELYKVQNKNEE